MFRFGWPTTCPRRAATRTERAPPTNPPTIPHYRYTNVNVDYCLTRYYEERTHNGERFTVILYSWVDIAGAEHLDNVTAILQQ